MLKSGQTPASQRGAEKDTFYSRFVHLLILLVLFPYALAQSAPREAIVTPPPPRLAAEYGKLPMSFEANQGQADPQVRFLSHGEGYSLFLTGGEAVLALQKPQKGDLESPKHSLLGRPGGRAMPRKTDVLRMQFVGSRRSVHPAGVDRLPGTANYFIGNDPSQWHTGVPTFGKVTYAGIYPGVDLVYYGNQNQLEYDFVVAPHADATSIHLRFAGGKKLKLDPNGNLEVIAKNGEITFRKPVIYQEKNGARLSVKGRFTLLKSDSVGFAIGKYDRSIPIVIDPILSYSTYLGGTNGASYGTAISVDGDGDAYVTGAVYATDFPATSGTYQKTNKESASTFDAFVAKLNPTGTALVYATYLGGSGNTSIAGTLNHGDYPTGIRVDSSGEAFVAGIAYSVDFPVTPGAFQPTNKGGANGVSNGFVTKINAAGSGLIYSTYLGGSGISGYAGQASLGDTGGDGCASIDIDTSGDVYVTGTAYSVDFPVTGGAYQTSNESASSGRPNAFIAKLNPQGTALDYATYLGGSNGDGGSGIAADSNEDAYIDGATYSTDFPVTSGALQNTNKASAAVGSNAFVAKLNSTGSSLVYSTYVGGSGNANGPSGNNNGDAALSIALDSSDNAYIFGLTASQDFPVTEGVFQSSNNAFAAGAPNYFIAKVNPSGSVLVYATYLGGSQPSLNAGSSGLAVDSGGDAYVTGYVLATDFPVSSNAYQSSPVCALATSGSVTEYASPVFAEINPGGTALLYSTYFGGTGGPSSVVEGTTFRTCDYGYGVALDSQNNAYLTGSAVSANFPTTSGALQTSNPANGSAFISKFLLNSGASAVPTTTTLASSEDPAPVGSSVAFTATVAPSSGIGVPTGTVTFTVDGGAGTAVTLNGSGQGSYTTSTLAAGAHTISASYSGDANDSTSSDSISETITGPAASIAVVSGSGQSATAGSAFAAPLVVLVKDANGNPVSGASVSFNGTSLSFANNTVATGANGTASTIATPTAAGTLTAMASTSGVSASAIFTLTGISTTAPTGPGIISTYAGDGTVGFSGDGGAATSAELDQPVGTAMDSAGNLYFSDSTNNRIRKVTPEGVISTYAGNGTAGFNGDGGAATSAELSGPLGIAFDDAGNLYIAESGNERVRKVTPLGIISTIAGNGTAGYNGDGIAATGAELNNPNGIVVDKSGNIYIGDYFNNRVRKVNTAGFISTVAGNGTGGYSGDGGLAIDAEVYWPAGLALDTSENLYIADDNNDRIREVNSDGMISTFAGTGYGGYNGDGIPATSAELYAPDRVTTDSAGNVYISEYGNNRIRKVNAGGIISTVAGTGTAGFSGDGGLATSAEINTPRGLTVDESGNLYISDAANNRIRKVQYQTSPPVFSPGAGTYTSAQIVAITDETAGASIYYTTDGSVPTTSSNEYTKPITISSSETLTAIATASQYSNSAAVSAAYVINITPASIALVSGSGQTTAYGSAFASPLVVIVRDASGNAVPGTVVNFSGAGLRFSGATATTGSNGEASVTATAVASGSLTASASTSGVTGTANFSLTATKAALTVTANNASVAYDRPIPALTYAVTGFVAGDAAGILTGSPAEATTAMQGSAPGTYAITITQGTLAAANYTFSFVNGTVTITSLGITATPSFSPPAGTYTSAQSVTISATPVSAIIYYTTDGTTPTTSSAQYSRAISVTGSETIGALAVAPGYSQSAVAKAVYTINLASPSFTLSASPSSTVVSEGQSAAFTLTVTPQNGFNQQVSFGCSGLPSGTACRFSPPGVTPAGAAANTTLTIGPAAAAASRPHSLWKMAGGGLAMALLFWPFRRRARCGIAVTALCAIACVIAGCGVGTNRRDYSVTVTASGGSVTQTTSLTITLVR